MTRYPAASLFDDTPQASTRDAFATDAVLLRGFAQDAAATLLVNLEIVFKQAPPRHMLTPGGRRMSVQNTNCGPLGWVSDRHGYRYVPNDPETGKAWPAMPDALVVLAGAAAQAAGFGAFVPDACLVNIYAPGTRLSLHQDRDERDFTAPIVSVSLGLPAIFLFGGLRRADRPRHVPLMHGDVVVWGGPARMRFHGVLALEEGEHALAGRQRINLTLRKAL